MKKPKRTLFVTVGTTAFSATNLGGSGKEAEDLRVEADNYLGDTEPKPDFFDRVLKAHREFWASGLPVYQNRRRTSAEMASSWYALRVQGGANLFDPEKDRIVLLSSATVQGQLAAKINEQLMRENLFSRDCTEEDAVVVEVIQGLEAKKGGFDCNIIDSVDKIWAEHQASKEMIVNITGGFKGTVPALTLQCKLSMEMTPDLDCTMFYSHESMDRAETIQFFPSGPPKQSVRQVSLIIS